LTCVEQGSVIAAFIMQGANQEFFLAMLVLT
jgi:hypothetical protein